MAKLVSKVYGDALYSIGVENNNLKQMQDEALILRKILKDNPKLLDLLSHPNVTSEKKEEVAKNIFEGKLSKEFMGVFILLIKKSRVIYIDSVLEYLIDKVNEYYKIGTVFVYSAMELDKQTKDKIYNRILETTKFNKIIINYGIDKNLIGGIVIRIGDRIIDASINHKIENIKSNLAKIQLT